jgi:hypothetical protein
MMFEEVGGSGSDKSDDDGAEPRASDSPERKRERVRWREHVIDDRNRALLLLAHELGGTAGDMAEILKKHSHSINERQKEGIRGKTLEQYSRQSEHKSFESFIAYLRKHTPPEARQEVRKDVYEYLAEHRPERLILKDERLRVLIAYMLGPGTLPPWTVRRILKEKVGLNFGLGENDYNPVEHQVTLRILKLREAGVDAEITDPKKRQRHLRARALSDLTKTLMEGLDPERGEVQAYQKEAEALTVEASVETDAKAEWRKDRLACAFVAEMLERGRPRERGEQHGATLSSIVNALEQYFGFPKYKERPFVYETPERLRHGAEQFFDQARRLADIAERIHLRAKAEKSSEREEKVHQWWDEAKSALARADTQASSPPSADTTERVAPPDFPSVRTMDAASFETHLRATRESLVTELVQKKHWLEGKARTEIYKTVKTWADEMRSKYGTMCDQTLSFSILISGWGAQVPGVRFSQNDFGGKDSALSLLSSLRTKLLKTNG